MGEANIQYVGGARAAPALSTQWTDGAREWAFGYVVEYDCAP